jgi:DNA-directed RNA polymerase subunit beta'
MSSKNINVKNFDAISINLASPDRVREWSHGEITKPETINYRTGRSERGGLFDERVFGPEKDFECYCGKYRRIRYKDIVCEKCGVEVTRSIVRRERAGHIELASPVAHIWFLRGIPSRMSILLNIPVSDLEKVIYFAGYIIIKSHPEEKERLLNDLDSEFKVKSKTVKDDETKERLKTLFMNAKKEIAEIYEGKVLNEIQYHHYSLKYGTCFEASIGAEAIYTLFKNIDLEKLRDITQVLVDKAGTSEREKLEKRLALIRSMIHADMRPEWMFLTVLPVIPPALRPMVALDGGRHATSDINDLYRRVINRNNRLKKLKEIGAPDVILRNEKRILQEAVDALLDNSIASQNDTQAMSQSQKRALKSLADNLKSKQGLFRQNLLGKRVDYSARSVIVIGPTLHLDQCGLPKHMALELFKPFVVSKLIEREFTYNIRGANKLVEDGIPEVWAILEEVIEGKYVLLNRAPTLHRLGIQAFRPILIEGNAIQLHPLVCAAFNADFDGDQMAVYLPLSKEAQAEARDLMASNKNLLKPQSGEPIVNPSHEIILGCYWMTKDVEGEKGEGSYYSSPNEAIAAYEHGVIDFRAKIKVLPTESKKYAHFEGKLFDTTVGKLLFNSILPNDFAYTGKEITKKVMSSLVDEMIGTIGVDAVPPVLDKIKDFGFKYSTISGSSFGYDNVKIPPGKKSIIAESRKKETLIIDQYNDGLLSKEEKYQKVIEIWEHAKKDVEKLIPETLNTAGSVYDMVVSGARGSVGQISQMAGMKGLIINTQGRTIDFPVIPSYKEGLSPIEYFIITHGSRKGLADTALNTAKAGYLTRRLVDVAQDVVVTEQDCKSKDGRYAEKDNVMGIEISLAKNLRGRITLEDVKNTRGDVVYKKGTLLSREDAAEIERMGVEKVYVRTPLTCKTVHGVCQMCYGLDLGRNKLVDIGEAVGIVAAQAIGEPGTQLTLRTFHSGGVAEVDITAGLPRVEEIFERRLPKNPAVICHGNGKVIEIRKLDKEKVIVVLEDNKGESKGDTKSNTTEYKVAFRRNPLVKVGDDVTSGQKLTDGSADISEIFKYGGKQLAEEYIIDEINKVYELQGASISRKHIEIIIRQMFSRVKIKNSGDTYFSTGETVELIELIEENNRAVDEGGAGAKADTIILGISDVSLTTTSWLSAASFQNTNRVLINNAVRGGVDRLRGLKENVIIGGLIPAGTGFKKNSGTQTE